MEQNASFLLLFLSIFSISGPNIKNDRPIVVFGDGSSSRDYIFIADVCQLMTLSLTRPNESDTFNLGTGTATSLSKLLEHVQASARTPSQVVHLPGRPCDIQSIALSPDRILQLMPQFRFTSLEVGIKQTFRSYGIGR